MNRHPDHIPSIGKSSECFFVRTFRLGLLLCVSCLLGTGLSEAQRRPPSFSPPTPDLPQEEVPETPSDLPAQDSPEESPETTVDGMAAEDFEAEPEEQEEEEYPFWQRLLQPGSGTTRTVGRRRGTAAGGRESSSEDALVPPPPEMIRYSPPPTSSSRLVIGEIVWVDEESNLAVGWLASRFAAVDDTLTTRNFELEQTAVLQPTRWRQGRSIGMKILSGHPEVGDEIIVSALPTEKAD